MRGTYIESEHFKIADTIGVPHPYCIGHRHVAWASDHWNGMLGKDAMRDAEKNGIHCAMKGCNLSYDEHEEALVVHCHAPIKDENGTPNPELHAMLLANKKEAERNGYAGFAFVDKNEEVPNGEAAEA